MQTVRNSLIAVLILTTAAFSQNPELQQKIVALKQAAAQNKQRLKQYQWVESQQATLKGEPKPAKQFLCQYGPDGQVDKTPIMGASGQPDQQQRMGKFKQRMVEKKKAEIQDYLGEVKGVLSMYLPPDPQRMQQAFQSGNVTINPAGDIIFKNYAQPNDQMIITFNLATKKIQHIGVDTYVQEPSQPVTLSAQFATLPDGTNYTQQTVLDMKAKQLSITTTNSQYQKLH